MTSVLDALVLVLGLSLLVVGLVRLAFVPAALVFEARRRRDDPGPAGCGPMFPEAPLVSVVVPAYEESVVIENCVRSVLRSEHPALEVVCVDDGSSDDTFERMQRLAAAHPQVRALRQENAGKGAALNTGIAAARGDVLVLVDADGLFRPDTVTRLLRGFRDTRVGSVCGNDRPVNLDRVQTRLLSLISHVGTGLMRRALDVLGCLPVVSGNIGAFRREVLERVGPLHTDTLGEDLELTWRVHRAGYRVTFAPDALVYAESPSTVRGLWRQRVRWARGLLQVTAMHRSMVGNPRYGPFGVYLIYNTLSQIVAPFVQVLAMVALAVLVLVDGPVWVPSSWWAWILLLGVPLSLALLLLAVLLDRAPGDLRQLWTLPLWPVYSTMMTFVLLDAARLELGNAENRWNKLDRSGTVSVSGLVDDDGPGS
ncbi:glycosyltransferase [Krasilnikoviella flava]|uniref:Glycosyltransferase, catalytic subunit of cellulose synthase and poly-beta-1,6-N-acetylglucosamine synthase n=1 Tax=Krasilnikoviella flava TaxID=526729 RepID=A0A1T5M2V7_9MICO|nr:glycosyltransferase family 2 protein [Krasilnikoviella flava]SKC82493.1 Glycosyltransferase, catalytic subunit of cellulose synthase and poly-beta-1,6-N-acetylglucosamine synthase [Krasilnikoviella flava]